MPDNGELGAKARFSSGFAVKSQNIRLAFTNNPQNFMCIFRWISLFQENFIFTQQQLDCILP